MFHKITHIVLFIGAIVWICFFINEIKKTKNSDKLTGEEKNKIIKGRSGLIILWIICAILSLISIVLDFSGLGNTPIAELI